jgi:hypothetical protein
VPHYITHFVNRRIRAPSPAVVIAAPPICVRLSSQPERAVPLKTVVARAGNLSVADHISEMRT